VSDLPRSSLSRRQFLKSGLALATCAWTLRPGSLLAYEPPRAPVLPCDPDCTRWALLSDTHIADDPENHYRGFYPYRNLQEVAAWIADDPPDGLVITGDLARLKGKVEAYKNFRALLAPMARQPIHLGLGNHDNRDDFFQTFGHGSHDDGVVENKHVLVREAGPVRLIVLDSLSRVNAFTGKLGSEQRTWLETILQTCDERPTILFLHHAPNGELLDTQRLFKIIKPVTKIKAVVHGHSHQYDYDQVTGIHVVSLPATGFNFSRREPVGWVQAKLTPKGGEFTLHAIGGDRRLDGTTQKLVWRT